jgi:hypothetical protein
LLLPWAEVPYPGSARDEFSYLLSGDTFASGRLTNPPHPQFRHFESPHILFQPTYSSKYPPGQGLALALGYALGHPWIGVLLSMAAMIVVAGWAMRAWLPPPYALLGATLLALRTGVMSYWANSYWGGAVAAIGGALLVGALPGLVKKPTPFGGAMLGLGLGILAISRPFEGFLFSAIVLLLWAALFLKQGGWTKIRGLGPAVAGGAVSLGIVLVWLGVFQAAVTGNPFKAPYAAWRDSYSRFESFIWETPVEDYRPVNEGYARFVNWVIESHEEYSSPFNRAARMGGQFISFYWGPMLALFMALGAWKFRYLQIRLLLLSVALTTLAILVIVDLWTFSHYFAPLTAALMIVGVQAIRVVMASARRRFGGPRPGYVFLLLGLPALLVALNLVGLFLRNTGRIWTTPYYSTGWCCYTFPSERARVERELDAQPGRHLVFVRHPAEGYWGAEWVYNGASIDGAKIVWAREVSPESDCALRRYYSGRQVWVTYVHEQPAQLTPLPDPGCAVPGGG